MKKLVLLLLVLFGVETWGVVGRAYADRVVYDCVVEAGPLCFAWEENAIGRVLGSDASEALEARLEEAREAWEEEVVERFTRKDRPSLDRVLDNLEDLAKDGIEAAKDAIRSVGD